MLKGFIDPNGMKVPLEEAFKDPERFDTTEDVLRLIAHREDVGDYYRVTELINGPRMSILMEENDFYIDPQGAVFMLLGTGVHYGLQIQEDSDKNVSETRLHMGKVTGQLDKWTFKGGKLIDYKVAGSYKVKIALGLKKDDNKKWQQSEKPDMEAWELQLNCYRVMLEKQGYEVNEMLIHTIVRDGGTFAARNNGIFKNLYMIPVKRLDNSYVIDYFNRKVEEREERNMRLCDGQESWNGRRCSGYCPVKEHCVAMGDNHYLASSSTQRRKA